MRARELMLRYIDIVLISLAAPILLLAGAPAVGYAIGAATWIALRLLGDAVNRAAFGVTALLVNVFAFTLQLGVSIADHVSPSRRATTTAAR
jgi:hypothetical protein